MRTLLVTFCILVLATMIFASQPIGLPGNTITSVSRVMTYQGILKDNAGDPVGDGGYNITFRLYDLPADGNLLWTSPPIQVHTVRGLFSAQFGPVNLPFDITYYLSIQIQGDSEMPQRIEITSNAYAVRSDTSDFATETKPKQIHGSVYRWAIFDTYHNDNGGWMMGNNAAMYGGVAPSIWTDGNGLAGSMSDDFEVLRTLFTKKGYGGTNAMIVSDVFHQYSSTNGEVAAVLFRIKNTTGNTISWSPEYCYTCYGDWGERASAAVNGTNIWNSSGNCGDNQSAIVDLSIPPSQTSTVIFVSTSSTSFSPVSYIQIRSLILAFKNNSLALPAGLEYVDDLDTVQ